MGSLCLILSACAAALRLMQSKKTKYYLICEPAWIFFLLHALPRNRFEHTDRGRDRNEISGVSQAEILRNTVLVGGAG